MHVELLLLELFADSKDTQMGIDKTEEVLATVARNYQGFCTPDHSIRVNLWESESLKVRTSEKEIIMEGSAMQHMALQETKAQSARFVPLGH